MDKATSDAIQQSQLTHEEFKRLLENANFEKDRYVPFTVERIFYRVYDRIVSLSDDFAGIDEILIDPDFMCISEEEQAVIDAPASFVQVAVSNPKTEGCLVEWTFHNEVYSFRLHDLSRRLNKLLPVEAAYDKSGLWASFNLVATAKSIFQDFENGDIDLAYNRMLYHFFWSFLGEAIFSSEEFSEMMEEEGTAPASYHYIFVSRNKRRIGMGVSRLFKRSIAYITRFITDAVGRDLHKEIAESFEFAEPIVTRSFSYYSTKKYGDRRTERHRRNIRFRRLGQTLRAFTNQEKIIALESLYAALTHFQTFTIYNRQNEAFTVDERDIAVRVFESILAATNHVFMFNLIFDFTYDIPFIDIYMPNEVPIQVNILKEEDIKEVFSGKTDNARFKRLGVIGMLRAVTGLPFSKRVDPVTTLTGAELAEIFVKFDAFQSGRPAASDVTARELAVQFNIKRNKTKQANTLINTTLKNRGYDVAAIKRYVNETIPNLYKAFFKAKVAGLIENFNPPARNPRRGVVKRHRSSGYTIEEMKNTYRVSITDTKFDAYRTKRLLTGLSLLLGKRGKKWRAKTYIFKKPHYSLSKVKAFIRKHLDKHSNPPETEEGIVIMAYHNNNAIILQVFDPEGKTLEETKIPKSDTKLYNVLYGIYLLRYEPDADGTPISAPEYEAVMDRNFRTLRFFLGRFYRHVAYAKNDATIEQIIENALVQEPSSIFSSSMVS